jgi:hypothetical protein
MLEHSDNFSIYGTNDALLVNGVYAENYANALTPDPDGISGGDVIRIGGGSASASSTAGLRYVLSANNTKVGICGRIWFASLPDGAHGTPIPLAWRDGTNTQIACVTVDTTGRLAFRKGEYFDAAQATTTNPVLTATGWYHIEAILDTVADTFELRVEGLPKLEADTLGIAATISQLFIGTRVTNTSAVTPFYWKDFVVYNGDGTENNDFLGTVLVVGMEDIADIALNWTPSTGTTGSAILSNVPPNDAEYITAPNPPPAAYVCEMSDLPPDVTSVKGIMTFVRAAKTDGGDANLQIGVISDPTGAPATALGDDRPITIAQTYWRDWFETDPKTGDPWLPAAVNAVHMQIDRTA